MAVPVRINEVMTGLVDAAHATFKPTEQRNVAVTLQKNMLRPSETNAA